MQTLSTVISVFLLLFIGYGAKKLRILKVEDAGVLNSMVLKLTMPAFIFKAIYDFRQALPGDIIKIPFVGFGMIAVVLVLGYLLGLALKLNRPTLGGMILACGFGNTGFLGYPVVQAAFHDKAGLLTAALYDEVAMALPMYTLGMFIAATFAGEKPTIGDLTKMLRLPILWAIPVAFILRPLDLPQPILSTLDYLARGTVPMVMVSLGLTLSGRSFKGLALPITAVCAVKLLVLPVITYYCARYAGMSGTIMKATVVEAGMPSAVMTCIVASQFGANERFVAGVVFVSTLLSILTIPVMLMLLGVS